MTSSSTDLLVKLHKHGVGCCTRPKYRAWDMQYNAAWQTSSEVQQPVADICLLRVATAASDGIVHHLGRG
jgi:hypothetical protein